MIAAVGDHIVIEPNAPDTATTGGIALPAGRKLATPSEGIVLSAGGGRYLKSGARTPPGVRPGDRVVFNSFGQTCAEWRRRGKTYVSCQEGDILAVIL